MTFPVEASSSVTKPLLAKPPSAFETSNMSPSSAIPLGLSNPRLSTRAVPRLSVPASTCARTAGAVAVTIPDKATNQSTTLAMRAVRRIPT